MVRRWDTNPPHRGFREIRVHELLGKRGVGEAVRTGIGMAKGEVLVVAMGDQSEDPEEIVRLAKSCMDCDIVFTNRFKHGRPRDCGIAGPLGSST
ncbi:MAG: hypothetical protein ABSD99_03535 [Candidatus Bathyarchaeia archaeon]|jgi:hypothetical protein